MAGTEGYNGAYTGPQIDAAIAKAQNSVSSTEFATGLNSVKPKAVPITLSASGWSNNAQAVTVNGVLADEIKQLIQPVPSSASQESYYESGVKCIGQSTNSLTFSCDSTPVGDLVVYIVIQEVIV